MQCIELADAELGVSVYECLVVRGGRWRCRARGRRGGPCLGVMSRALISLLARGRPPIPEWGRW